MNKDVFEPSCNDLKFTARDANNFFTNLNQPHRTGLCSKKHRQPEPPVHFRCTQLHPQAASQKPQTCAEMWTEHKFSFWSGSWGPTCHAAQPKKKAKLFTVLSVNQVFGLPWWLGIKEASCECCRHRFGPWVRKIPWRRKWQSTLQYSCLENLMDRGAWQATVHGVARSQTWLKQLNTAYRCPQQNSGSLTWFLLFLPPYKASWYFRMDICLLGGLDGKESACSAGDLGLIPG